MENTKRNKIIYWIATIWLSLGMLSTGFIQLFQLKEEVAFITKMGYPGYFVSILGGWKILGVIAILIPKFPLVKEWAYAGFFFTMSGALLSHILVGNGMAEIGPTLLLLALIAISWYFRPSGRKLIFVNQ